MPRRLLTTSGSGGSVGGRIVDLTLGRVNRPCKLLLVERELRVNAGLVASWVLPMPRTVEIHGDETVKSVGASGSIEETLIAQASRDVLGSQQRCEQVRLGVAETDSLTQSLTGGKRDASVVNVERMRDVVADPLEGGLSLVDVVVVGRPQFGSEGYDLRVPALDDLVGPEVLMRVLRDEIHGKSAYDTHRTAQAPCRSLRIRVTSSRSGPLS